MGGVGDGNGRDWVQGMEGVGKGYGRGCVMRNYREVSVRQEKRNEVERGTGIRAVKR